MWKDVEGYEGSYQVSNKGEVRSVSRFVTYPDGRKPRYREGVIVSQQVDTCGYCMVTLQGKRFRVHRLVAKAFIDNPDNLPTVNHLDENPSNNVVENLAWCTHKEKLMYSMKYGDDNKKSKVSVKQISEMVALFEQGVKQKDIGAKYGLSQSQVSRLVRGQGRKSGL